MLQGLYSAATGLDAAIQRHEIVAHNLAHINVPGFRRSVATSKTFESQLDNELGEAGQLGTYLGEVKTDFSPGALQRTGRPLDVALNGDGFFVLKGPNGPLYTRNGVFHIDGQNRLVTVMGLVVQGENGPITFPEGTSPSAIHIAKDGTIQVSIEAEPQEVGKLKIVAFDDNQMLVPAGTTTFEAPPGTPSRAADAAVVQGARESSNVSAVTELVQLIGGYRYFEASQRAMQTISDTIHNNTDPNTG